MKEGKKFNLLDEPWILVMRPDGGTEAVSLLNLFRCAPEFQGLAGELPTQNVAVLRLLLAILHAVFGRYDLNGNYARLSSPSESLMRWKSLWDRGTFPMEIVGDYLSYFKDRFWLFHDKRPFYQVAELSRATVYTAAKLNGELSESNNKVRLFPQRTGRGKSRLSYAEAARWLIYVNAFDDTSAKPTLGGLPSPGAGWLGKLGLVTAVGDNLFETLMLNFILLRDGENVLWGEEKPAWEAETAKADERTAIALPDNPSELLTLQSRRLLLKCEGNEVIGYALLGGDFFQKENSISEQMTVWRNAAKKAADPPEYLPRRHDPTRQLWRDFSTLIIHSEGKRRPGVVSWLARLKTDNLIPRAQFRFITTAVKYGDKDFFVDDVFSDSLSLSADLLTSLGEDWINRILSEIDTTERLVEQAALLAQNLAKARGDADGVNQRDAAKEHAYFRLDAPFREWLVGIVPERDNGNKDEVCLVWWEQASRIVRELGGEFVTGAGPKAFVGREIKEKSNGKVVTRQYAGPKSYNYFLYRTSNLETLKGGALNG